MGMKHLFIFCLHLIVLITCAISADTAQFEMWQATECGSSAYNYTANSTYKSNLDALLNNITTLDIKYGFYNFSTGQPPDQVQEIALCRGDINVTECHACLKFLIANLTATCPIEQGASGWADKCMLRYGSDSLLDGRWVARPRYYLYTDVDPGGNFTHFANVVQQLLMGLPSYAAAGDYKLKYAYGQAIVNASLKVFATMQCTPELKPSDCLGCLYLGMYYIYTNPNQTGAKILQPSCSIRYEVYKFYKGSSSGSGNKGVNLIKVIFSLAAILATTLFLLAAFLVWLLPNQRNANKVKRKRSHFKSLEMDSSIIKDATRNFAKANILGDETSRISSVYKVKLHGKEIAVKKIKGTRYLSSDEILTAKLQHTNLVELLGVCSYGKEKLLIFEYVTRGRLDEVLFGPKCQELDWKKRCIIIQGIAQGLKYLHSRHPNAVVHCDLNGANIYLDKHWSPKITDFRSARVMKSNKKGEIVAAVTLKLGQSNAYMPPEYFSSDEISDKLDVYSFGVIVLEILAGRKSVEHGQEDLIALARRTFHRGGILEFIDPRIKPTCDSAGMQMKECVKIALECLHEDAKVRADTASVVNMLGKLDQLSTFESIPSSSTPQPQNLLRNRFPSSEIN